MRTAVRNTGARAEVMELRNLMHDYFDGKISNEEFEAKRKEIEGRQLRLPAGDIDVDEN